MAALGTNINTATEAGIVYESCSEGLRPATHSFHNSKGVNGLRELKRPSAISNSFSLFYARELLTNRCIRDLHYFIFQLSVWPMMKSCKNLLSFCAL